MNSRMKNKYIVFILCLFVFTCVCFCLVVLCVFVVVYLGFFVCFFIVVLFYFYGEGVGGSLISMFFKIMSQCIVRKFSGRAN